MYVPFWLFDSTVDAQAEFKAAIVRIYDTANETVTERRVYNCQRAGEMQFVKIPADGSKKMNDDFMDSIEPFNYNELVEFNTAYLTGYLADKYDVSAEECTERVNKRMENSAIAVLKSSVDGYDECEVEDYAVVKDIGKVLYAMVPVWILTTRYNDKPYTFMMNGQTGKVVGSLPYSFGKSLLYPAILTLVLIPIIYFLIMMLS